MKLYTLEVTDGRTFFGRVFCRVRMVEGVFFTKKDGKFYLKNPLLKVFLTPEAVGSLEPGNILHDGFFQATFPEKSNGGTFKLDQSGDEGNPDALLVHVAISSLSETKRYLVLEGSRGKKGDPLAMDADMSSPNKSILFYFCHNNSGFNIVGPDGRLIESFYCKNGKILSLSPWWKRIIMRWIGV